MNDQDLLRATTITAGDLSAVDVPQVLDRLGEFGVAVVHGLVREEAMSAVKNRISRNLDPVNDHPGIGESPEQLYANYQKLAINGGEFRELAHPQCVRSYYNPLFAPDVFGMHGAFRVTARLRNMLMGAPRDWAVDSIEDGFWTAARIHHYPGGGGFMSAHCENYVPKFYEEAGLDNAYYQPLIVMSRRGETGSCDYASGGGYFCHDNRKVYYDQYLTPGDIVFYDTRITHGVTEVDPAKPFVQGSPAGRYSGLVTLYRDLS